MEDDDEFGDLYTDVLRPFASSSSFAPPPHLSPAPPSSNRSIDLNLHTDDDEILYGGSHSNSAISHKSMDQAAAPNQAVAVKESIPASADNSVRDMIDLGQMDKSRHEKEEDSAQGARTIERGDAELADRALQDMSFGKESANDDSRNEVGVKGVDLMDKDVKFDIEEDGDGIEDAGSEPVIPGLSTGAGGAFDAATGAEASRRVDESGERGEGDDWDSDSEDDLQIVLNDNNHMAMERGGMVDDDDDEDEDGDPLVIVADGDPNQAVEEQEWGEDTAQTADNERKDMGESAKASGGVTVAPKVGYSNHGFHPFHSQFKYVRPGAAPMPGPTTSAPGGPPGQIRPLGPMAGRGRGDWRPAGMKGTPPMQKGFHSGPGLPVWGNSAAGRGFGGGLEFTLPSHKTIFDVDIDGFEEKPWKYPSVDASDFFNFGLNEESWKDYCKQLEQLRLESTMQSKIRVYESGRTEQFDPDLPPELAAATGIRDIPVDNANSVKPDVGQNNLAKGSGRVRLPLPTGRAIQVENGYGERLPSIDTRPPRIRDSDAIIEIVLQDSADDDSHGGNVGQDQPEGETLREDFREDHVVGDEITHMENKSFDDFPPHYNGRKRERSGRRMLFTNSSPSSIPEEDEVLPFHQEEPVEYPGSRDQSPRYSCGNFGASYEERRTRGRTCDQSPCITPSQEITMVDNQKEESFGSMEGGRSAPSSSPVIKDARDSSMEDKYADHDDTGTADGSSKMEKEEMDLNTMDRGDDLKDVEAKRQKLTSQVEQPLLDEVDDWDDSKAPRSSDDSKARSASSREYQKRRDGFEEEVVQDAWSRHPDGIRRHPDENEQGFRRKEHEGKQELDLKRVVHKAREESYPYKDRHPSSAQQLHTKADGFDRQKDRDNSDIVWVRKDDDPYGRRVRNDESRKRDRGKVRENERSDKDDSLHSKKQFGNGSYRVPYDKDVGSRNSRHRERDDSFKSRYEGMEDYHRKRRKDEDYLRKNHIDKEEIMSGYKENSNRQRRERDEVLDLQKRDDQQSSKDNLDDHYTVRQKDEGWLPRERSDRQRDREEWQRVKQSHEEHPSKREREEGRGAVRSGRVTEEKWVGHARSKDEHKVSDKDYPSRETMRLPEQSKRRERIQDENPHHRGHEEAYARGNQYSSEEKRLRQERSSSRSDHAASASDNPRVHERKHKEGTRKSRESDFSDHNSLGLSKRNQDKSGQINEMSLKGSGDEGRAENELPGHHLSRKHQGGISSGDEQQDSYRGRSKLERWTSHKERDFSINSKSSSSLKFKHIDKDNNDGSSEAEKAVDESTKAVDAIENQNFLTAEGKDSVDMDADAKGVGDRHLDTVEKLKKRSERFKLPMPSEKDALAIKKMECEPLSSAKSENPVDPEVKQERPARKRRWISG
ncbi:hypothetical protein L6164_014210 [Bauhinia variegata]|uniref:Uncharacterized protein n=1 Tax=Bauhinia variegata TaxID=167791 RepID=A0ACB9NIA0_BAUVA|nr:hypothetical protein L6164_014210 [Bauhinia variegata]